MLFLRFGVPMTMARKMPSRPPSKQRFLFIPFLSLHQTFPPRVRPSFSCSSSFQQTFSSLPSSPRFRLDEVCEKPQSLLKGASPGPLSQFSPGTTRGTPPRPPAHQFSLAPIRQISAPPAARCGEQVNPPSSLLREPPAFKTPPQRY